MSYIGDTLVMKCGMSCTVVKYNNYADIVVKFEDGTEVATSYSNFKKKIVFNPSLGEPHRFYKRQEMKKHIGESRKNSQGLNVEIIDAGTKSGVKIKYETGDIKDNVEYWTYLNAPLALKGYSSLIGTSFTNTQGEEVKIISRGTKRGCFNVMFSDKTIRENVDLKSINQKQVRHPKYKLANENIGLTNRNTQGKLIKIVSVSDNGLSYDIEFEDGVIRKNVTFSAFKRGEVPHPSEKNKHIGKKFLSRQGLVYEIIDKGSKGGTWKVKFPDGAILDNINYAKIKSCNLCHPNLLTNGAGTFGVYKGYNVRMSFSLGNKDIYYICRNKDNCIIARLCDL